MNDDTHSGNCQKTKKNTLTELSAAANLKIAPKSPQANRRVSKQLKGGKVDTTQPPHVSGFFMPVNLIGNDTSLPGGYGIEKRLRVNTCGGVPLSHLETPDSFATVTTLNNSKGTTAMKNANTHGLTTSVVATPGTCSDQCNDCLLPASVLTDTIHQAKAQAANSGKFGTANAYAQLLKHFHAAIFPALIDETDGNISQISRLLGIHRESVSKYAESVGMKSLLGAGQGVRS